MDPAAWRKREGLALRDLAARFRMAWSSVRRYERGESDAPTSVALLYVRLSKGEVTGEDLNRVRKRFLHTANEPPSEDGASTEAA